MKILAPARFTKTVLPTAAFLVALLSTTALPILMNPPSALAYTDTYPTSIAGCRAVSGNPSGSFTCDLKDSTQDIYFDPWSEENRECTSYAAWMLSSVNGFTMPFFDDAKNWGPDATSRGYTVNMTPAVGSIYWSNAGTYGHVAYVQAVSSDGTHVDTTDYNSDFTGHFAQELNVATSSASGYIHFKDNGGASNGSTPAAISRSSSSMDLFYNDNSAGKLYNYGWTSTNSWSSQSWSDSGGIMGQPAVVDRTSDTMDVFYTTAQHKLIHKGWWANSGWVYFDVLENSGVAGSPTAVARDSNNIQVFYRDTSGNIDSAYWYYGTWYYAAPNSQYPNPQQLYTGAATTDPYSVTRGPGYMDVFFGKNNGNIVNVGWNSVSGWGTQDWGTNSPVKYMPTAIVRGSGMSSYYAMNNGNVGEEAYDSQNGWSGQYWTAQLVGSPSAVAGVSNVIDNFYRETGGNIVDRYFTGYAWQSTNIANAGNATGDPFAITRSGGIEVFYWNGSKLMDNNWNSGSQTWNGGSQIN